MAAAGYLGAQSLYLFWENEKEVLYFLLFPENFCFLLSPSSGE